MGHGPLCPPLPWILKWVNWRTLDADKFSFFFLIRAGYDHGDRFLLWLKVLVGIPILFKDPFMNQVCRGPFLV